MDEQDLHMMVGEIRSDVKKLLVNSGETDKRVGTLEKKWWTTIALVGLWATTAVAHAIGLYH
jgi:hypothetical protein